MIEGKQTCNFCKKPLAEKEVYTCHFCKKPFCFDHMYGLKHNCPQVVKAEQYRVKQNKMSNIIVILYAVTAVAGLSGLTSLEGTISQENPLFTIGSLSIAAICGIITIYLKRKWKTQIPFFGKRF